MRWTIFLLPVFLFFVACEDEGERLNACSSDFEQEGLFLTVASGLIVPGYADLQMKVDAMQASAENLAEDGSIANLEDLRQNFRNAYRSWQRVAQYEFGPAEDVFLRSSVNSFPAEIEQILTNIEEGNADLDAGFNAFARGFPALDFLLYGVAPSETEILDFLNTPNARKYLSDVISDIKTRVDATYVGWTDGDYQSAFIQNTGTAAGTSLSLIINALNEHYEMIRREKIGIPSGLASFGFAEPEAAEGFYSGLSTALALEALRASENLYSGAANVGLDDYLQTINAKKDGEALDEIITQQFQTAIQAFEKVDSTIPEAANDDAEDLENAYVEIVKQVVNIKTDMPSVLCVEITYVDNPSDSD